MQPIYPNGRMQGMYAPVPPAYANGGPGMYGPNGIAGFGGYGMYGRDMVPAPGMNGQWGLLDRPQPKHDPRFPILRSILCPEPFYMTTTPVPPMPTYQTRGPRDFFLDPSVTGFGDIGY